MAMGKKGGCKAKERIKRKKKAVVLQGKEWRGGRIRQVHSIEGRRG